MLINMIHDNHGEPPFKTRYREPAALRAMGYEAVVIPDALAAIPGAFVDPGNETVARAASVTPRKPQELADAIDAQVAAAAAAGMAVYFVVLRLMGIHPIAAARELLPHGLAFRRTRVPGAGAGRAA